MWEETEQSPHHSLLSWILPSCGITNEQEINWSPVLTLVPPVAFGELLNTRHVQVSLLYIYIHISMYTHILQKSYLFNLLQCSRKQRIMLKHLKVRSSITYRDQEPQENEQWFLRSLQSSGVHNLWKSGPFRESLKAGEKLLKNLGGGEINIYIHTIRKHHNQPKALMGKPLICNSKPLFCLNPPLTILSDLLSRKSLLWKDLSSSTVSAC